MWLHVALQQPLGVDNIWRGNRKSFDSGAATRANLRDAKKQMEAATPPIKVNKEGGNSKT